MVSRPLSPGSSTYPTIRAVWNSDAKPDELTVDRASKYMADKDTADFKARGSIIRAAYTTSA